jgi:hypothetical protein
VATGDDPNRIPNVIQRVQGGKITLPRHAENRVDTMQNQGIHQNLTTRAQSAPRDNYLFLFDYYDASNS